MGRWPSPGGCRKYRSSVTFPPLSSTFASFCIGGICVKATSLRLVLGGRDLAWSEPSYLKASSWQLEAGDPLLQGGTHSATLQSMRICV